MHFTCTHVSLGHQPFGSGCTCTSFLVLLLSFPIFSIAPSRKFIHWRARESRRNPRTWGGTHPPIVRLALLLRRHVHFGPAVQRSRVLLQYYCFSFFATRIYHCDVNSNDALCLDNVKDLEHCTDDPQGVALYFLTTDRPEPVSSPCA